MYSSFNVLGGWWLGKIGGNLGCMWDDKIVVLQCIVLVFEVLLVLYNMF